MKIKLPVLALAALLFAGLPLASSSANVGISVAIAPPGIPIYQQPYCPAPGYIWTPGYWAYSDFGYYWVPGVWVAPPRVGFLWTPGYWGYRGGSYYFNDGYWGPSVGFYGGINYGYGYTGYGYYGGQWAGNTFRYNTAVSRVNTSVITNTYVDRAALSKTGSRAGFNGPGGAKAKPSKQQQAAAKAEHAAPTSEQRSRVEAAKNDPALHAKNNKGKPNAEAIQALDRKDGQRPAAAVEKQAGAKKAKGGAAQEANGNSAFGQRQGDATTRTRGSQNNAYGKAQSADAHGSRPAAKAARTEEAAAPHAREAKQAKRNAPTDTAKAAPRAAQRAKVESRRPQTAKARQAGPGPRGRAPVQAAQPGKKAEQPGKKKKDKKPDGG